MTMKGHADIDAENHAAHLPPPLQFRRRQQTPYRFSHPTKKLSATDSFSSRTPMADISNQVSSANFTPLRQTLGTPIPKFNTDLWNTPISPIRSSRTKSPFIHRRTPMTPYSPSMADTSALTAQSHLTNTTYMTDATMFLNDSVFSARGGYRSSWAGYLMNLITWNNPRHTWAAISCLLVLYSMSRLVKFDLPTSCVLLVVFSLVTLILYGQSWIRSFTADESTAVSGFDQAQFEYQVFSFIKPLGIIFDKYFGIVNGVGGLAQVATLVGSMWLLVLCRLFVAEWDTITLVCCLAVLCVPQMATRTWEGFIGPESPQPLDRNQTPPVESSDTNDTGE